MFSFFKTKKKTLSLFLSGGAVRGIAHIGVLKAFEEFKWPIDIIYGSSSGAIVASLFCAGMSSNELVAVLPKLSIRDFLKVKLSRQALFSSEAIQLFIEKNIGKITFKDLKIPLGILATNIITAESEILNDPNLSVASAVRASSSIPGVFSPTVINNQSYVDGALSCDVNLNYQHCDVKIACNAISEKPIQSAPTTLYELIDRSIECMMISNAQFNKDIYDLQLNVVDKPMSSIDLKKSVYLVEYAYDFIKQNRNKIEALL